MLQNRTNKSYLTARDINQVVIGIINVGDISIQLINEMHVVIAAATAASAVRISCGLFVFSFSLENAALVKARSRA